MRWTRSSATPIVSARPCVTTATRRTGSARGGVDPGVEVIGKLRPVAVDEVEEELAVALRAGQAGVYDGSGLGVPAGRGFCEFAEDAAVDSRVADDASRRLGAASLELRLDEDERLPAGLRRLERGWQREAERDEGDVADDEVRRVREVLRAE